VRRGISRAKFQPQPVGVFLKKDDVAFLGTDPGAEMTEAWWEEMLVQWFDVLGKACRRWSQRRGRGWLLVYRWINMMGQAYLFLQNETIKREKPAILRLQTNPGAGLAGREGYI
jgi:hypothetical protein